MLQQLTSNLNDRIFRDPVYSKVSLYLFALILFFGMFSALRHQRTEIDLIEARQVRSATKIIELETLLQASIDSSSVGGPSSLEVSPSEVRTTSYLIEI